MTQLKPCPCGKIPFELHIDDSGPSRFATASGNCCDEWMIEFRSNYEPTDSDAMKLLAIEAWNKAPRG